MRLSWREDEEPGTHNPNDEAEAREANQLVVQANLLRERRAAIQRQRAHEDEERARQRAHEDEELARTRDGADEQMNQEQDGLQGQIRAEIFHLQAALL